MVPSLVPMWRIVLLPVPDIFCRDRCSYYSEVTFFQTTAMVSKTSPPDRHASWPIVATVSCTVVAGAAYAILLWRHRRKRNRNDNDDEENANRPNGASFHPTTDNNNHASLLLALLPSHLKYQMQKDERRRAKLPWLTRKTPLYDNIHMLGPTGHLLCNVSNKKANWYLRKQLAMWTDDHHTTIQLLFKPQGGNNDARSSKSNSEDNTTATSTNDGTCGDDQSKKRLYTTSVKQNICVVCGASSNLIRHYVVPWSYRKLFPHQFKSHQPHDIVLLCADCQISSDQLYQERMQAMEQRCRPPDEYERHTAMSHFIDPHLTKVQSCALALLRYQQQMPRERIQEYEQFLSQHVVHQQNRGEAPASETIFLTNEQLEILSQTDVMVVNEHYIPGANLVMAALTSDQQITDFILDWRHFFVEHMQPQYLPIGWSIDSPVVSDSRAKNEESVATNE